MYTRVESSSPGVFRFLSTYFVVVVVSFRHVHVAVSPFDARGITWLRNSSVYMGWRVQILTGWRVRTPTSYPIVSYCCCRCWWCCCCFYIENHSDNRLPLLLILTRVYLCIRCFGKLCLWFWTQTLHKKSHNNFDLEERRGFSLIASDPLDSKAGEYHI